MNTFLASAMKRNLSVLTAIGLCGTALSSPAFAAPTADDCARLANLSLADVSIKEAVAVPASNGAIKAPHCRVNGVIGAEIHFSLLLPDQWNGKFAMGGGGGFVGSVDNQALSSINAGYATVGTDTGHQAGGTDGKWAWNHPDRIANYGHLAVHRTSEVAKTIVQKYYGTGAARSYFLGCSNGGRQAMMEAQRYPDDFDGIVAGAPAMNFTGIGAQFIKDEQVLFPNSKDLRTALLPPETLKFVESKVLEACDALDGVKDGVMEDPRQCKFDLATLPSCANDQPGAQCVTAAQRNALKVVHGETRNKNGLIFQGQPFGGESEPAGWQAWIAGVNPPMLAIQNAPNLRFAFGTEMFKYFMFGDPNWDYTHYDFTNWQQDAAQVGAQINATNIDLDAFKKKGHKLVLWHGWSDSGLSALGTVKYYEDVQARDPKLRDYFRMFMLPGVLHCGGGPGPDTVDWASVISNWVENGKAPERIIAQKLSAGSVTRSRPLCVYPQKAAYVGKGSTDDAANFECR